MFDTAETAWRERRRQSARQAILDASWAIVREHGLAALSLRELARRAGITTPTVYAYFDSKHAIYDAMFGEAASAFADHMGRPYEGDPDAVVLQGVQRFVQFCMADLARYQLLFQRVIPDFEPSPEAYEPALRSLAGTRARLAGAGVHDPSHLDLFTALVSGLMSQQFANDPGGDRWAGLAEEAVTMFLHHCRATESGPEDP